MMKMFTCTCAQDEMTPSKATGPFKKSIQQGRRHFYARRICYIREHGKMAGTPLAAFFNRPSENILMASHLETFCAETRGWPASD